MSWKALWALIATITISLDGPAFGGDGSQVRWSIDRNVVMLGGCVSLVLEGSLTATSGLSISLDNSVFFPIGKEAWPTIRHRGRTLVLIWMSSNDFLMQRFSGEQVLGNFGHVGTVVLTLRSGDTTLGTQTITVTPADSAALDAVARLYPIVPHNKKAALTDVVWPYLVVDHSIGSNGEFAPDELALLRAELPLMLKHPDWAEIIEMRVAKLEADLERDAVRQLVDEADPDQWDAIIERPLPEFLAQALEKKVVSPYAQALQDKTRESVRARKYLVPPYRIPGRIQD